MESKLKLGSKNAQFIFIVAGLIILFLAYKFGFSNISSSTNKINDEVKKLETRCNDLKEKKAHKSEFEATIAEDTKEVDDVFNRFPRKFDMSSFIKYLTTILRENKFDISSVAYSPEETVAYEFVDKNNENKAGKDSVVSRVVTVNYTCSYKALKEVTDILNFGDTRVKLDEIVANYDENSGGVSGTIKLNVYSINSSDVGKEYKEPEFDIKDTGKDDLFETYDTKKKNSSKSKASSKKKKN